MSKSRKANNIRLISGRWRGTRLAVLDSLGLRPTTDRVRETVFNWLMHDISGARCLDLFAGSGALGLECLSRSASFVQFVEQDKKVAAELRGNLQRLAVTDTEANIVTGDALTFLSTPAKQPFDLVFLDPPFNSNLLAQIPQLLESQHYLALDTLVYVEQAAQAGSSSVFSMPEHWRIYKQGRAGQSDYALYHRA